jgi:hypothetical protein
MDADAVKLLEETSKKPPTFKSVKWNVLLLYTNIGFSIAFCLVGGAFLGKYLGDRMGYPREGALLGIGIGFVFSIIQLVSLFRTFLKNLS